MSLYSIKNFEGHFIIAKFTGDLDLESSYEYHIINGVHTCHCPAGVRPTCRHRQMFPMLSLRCDSGWFLDFDTRQWVDPTGEAVSALAIPERTVHTTIEQDVMTGHASVQDEEANAACAPNRDEHPFRRRM